MLYVGSVDVVCNFTVVSKEFFYLCARKLNCHRFRCKIAKFPTVLVKNSRTTRAKILQEGLYGLKKILQFEFAACFLSPSKGAKKCGKFKLKNCYQSIESSLFRLSSKLLSVTNNCVGLQSAATRHVGHNNSANVSH